MKALDKKLLRDAYAARGQVLTTALVVASAVAAFLSMRGTYRSLEASQAAYYERQGFAHVWVRLRRAPLAEAAKLHALPGVMAVDVRVVADGKVLVPGIAEAAVGHFLSAPDDLRGLHVTSGSAPAGPRETLLLDAFARAHTLGPGDRVVAIVEGKRLELTISGLAMSPEYIFALGPTGMPDPKRVAVLWLDPTALAAAAGLTGSWNEAALRLAPGATEEPVIEAVDRLTAPYGGAGAYGRKLQMSHLFVDNEIRQLAGMALWIPAIFLAVGAFLLYMVLGRLLQVQREQIAALKALGYRRARIALHYLELTAIILVAGNLLGILLGVWGGRWFTGIYVEIFHFPVLEFVLDASLLTQVMLLTIGTGVVATLRVVWGAVRVPPAEAMRPPSPTVYRVGFLSRLRLTRLVDHMGRMIIRELERRPWRALISTLGIALGIAILVVGRFQNDVMAFIAHEQFGRADRSDAMVGFVRPLEARAVHRLAALPGVLAVEPLRAVPVRIFAGHHHREIVLTGLPADSALRAIVDEHERIAQLPGRGLMLSARLGEVLGVGPGDRVGLALREGDHGTRWATVAALVDDLQGLQAYARLDVLDHLLGATPTASGAMLTIDGARRDELARALDELGTVATVSWHQDILDAFQGTSADWARTMTIIITVFGMILAVGVVYNNARVAVSERSRELASLRVLGFTRAEISFLLLGEIVVHLALAIPAGLLLGRFFCFLIMMAADPDLYRIPLVISGETYGFALIIVLGAAAISALLVRRRLDRLDLVAVLKARD